MIVPTSTVGCAASSEAGAHPHITEILVAGDPLVVMTSVVDDLDGADHVLYENDGEWSLGVGVAASITVTPHTVRFDAGQDGWERPWTGDSLGAVESALAQLRRSDWRVYGIVGFELALAGTAEVAELPADLVLLRLVLPAAEVRLADGRARVLADDPGQADCLLAALRRPPRSAGAPKPVAIPLHDDDGDDYRERVGRAIGAIRAGHLEKVIVSRTVTVPADVDMTASFRLGRRRNTPARSFLLRVDGLAAAGFSPEIVVAVDRRRIVRTQPLAGTRAYGAGAVADARCREELVSDPKEIYEHAVSVRRSVSELSELCVAGTVAVADFMSVSLRGTAQHLASTVVGELAEGAGPWDALRTLFPAVTASGIPKAAACAYVYRHEPESRGLYAGAVLVADADGRLDAALALRSMFQRDGRTWLRAGAGIVAASDPDREFTETCEKLRSVSLAVVTRTDRPIRKEPLVDHSEIVRNLRADVADLLDLPPSEVDPNRSVIEQGLDSVGLMTLASKWSGSGVSVKIADLARWPRLVDWPELVLGRTPGQA